MRLILLILLSVCYADVIHVPADYSTIQEGIDAAAQDDIVVVSPATYEENIIIDKTITLTSLALFNTETETIIDSLDTWFDWVITQYEITNDSILTTIIDGSQPVNDSLGSTILIKAADDDCISPKILGFTITGGKGTLINRSYVNPETGDTTYTPQYLGGGLFSYVTTPDIRYNYFYNNGSMDIEEGGAVYAVSDPDDCPFPTRSRCEIDEIDFSHNFFRDNTSRLGKILANRFFDDEIKLTNCVFDYYCEATGNPNIYWVKVDEPEEVDYEETTSDGCPIDWDVWVSPDGSDDSETGYESEPFQTINWALSVVVGTEDNPVTINLTVGTFSPSTNGESFSINMISNVNLIGQGEEVTILDAEQTGRGITIDNCQNNIISDLNITGGFTEVGYGGGGMFLWSSNLKLNYVTINGNTAKNIGGGMSLFFSNPMLTHVTISENTATFNSDNDGGAGGGMCLISSNPTLAHITISENTANGIGGGMILSFSDPALSHVTICDNTAGILHGGMYLSYSDPILTHVTISGNAADISGGVIGLSNSNPSLINSIIWDNSLESIHLYGEEDEPIITYSDIQGGWQGDGNIDADPLFNEDFSLQVGSPCIDSGNPNLWYTDLDGTRADMGVTGGLFVLPNFISHDFWEVGDFGSNKKFTVYNYRQLPVTISEVNFNTSSFTTNTNFPITIEPLQTSIINIEANNSSIEFVEDAMELVSENLPDSISISLSVSGVEGNVLTGNLSGTYPSATYRISGDLNIANGDTVYLQEGTVLLFDGGVNFNIYGTLIAIGTETDSIIFDNYSIEKWRGFTLIGVSDETLFKYVRVSGADKDNGGGMCLTSNSNPTLTHVAIRGNTGEHLGGGMYLDYSNPTLTDVTIVGNTSTHSGGGMRLQYSNPTLTRVTINGNTANQGGGGMSLLNSNPIFTLVTISGNTAISGSGIRLYNSNPTLTHVTISWNTANNGGGMYLFNSNLTLINSIFWDNSPESIYFDDSGTPNTIIINYSDIEGGEGGITTNDNGEIYWLEGSIDADPLFTNPDNGDYTLQESSPCIDSGIVLEDMEYCGEAPEMGAYEYIADDCLGCTDEAACNYDDTVIQDDGSCEYPEENYDCDGNELSLTNNIPVKYHFNPGYPNPFNPITNITYGLPEVGNVTLNVYNIQGRQVQTLVDDFQTAGYHTINWNASYYPSGVYLIRMESGSFTQTQKVVLVK